MDLDTFIIAVFCWIDQALPHVTGGQRLRQRGPEPVLYDSEVLTMEVVGTYLGLRQVHRTTVVRQAANLWQVKERLWQHLLAVVPHDPQCAILDSLPLHVCQLARAPRCRRFRGEAAYGKDHVIKQTYRPISASACRHGSAGLGCSHACAWLPPILPILTLPRP